MSKPKYAIQIKHDILHNTSIIGFQHAQLIISEEKRKNRAYINVCLWSETFHTTKVHQQRKFIAMDKFKRKGSGWLFHVYLSSTSKRLASGKSNTNMYVHLLSNIKCYQRNGKKS